MKKLFLCLLMSLSISATASAALTYNFIETGSNAVLAEIQISAVPAGVPEITSLTVDPVFGFGSGNLVGAPTGFLQFLAGSMILHDGIGGLSGDLAVTTLEGAGFNPPGGGIKLFAKFAAAAGADAIGDSFGERRGDWQLATKPLIYNFVETGTNALFAEIQVVALPAGVSEIVSLKVDPVFGFGSGSLVGAPTGFLQFLEGSMILNDGIGGLSGDLAVTTLEGPGFNPPGGGIKLFAKFAAAAGADGIGDSFGGKSGDWKLAPESDPVFSDGFEDP